MKVKRLKTVRFNQLVKESGTPSQVTLWVAPEEDRSFMNAVKEGRVLTIFQRNVGTQKDFGMIGFFKERSAAFLVFPKALRHEAETKVVGIKYEALAETEPEGPLFKPSAKRKLPMREKARRKAPSQSGQKKEIQKVPEEKMFSSAVEITARQTVVLTVEARTRGEAERKLREQAAGVELDLKKARITRTSRKPAQR